MEQVRYFFTHLLDTSGFPPRWFCGQWSGFHGWLYILSDLTTWLAYTSIPIWLAFFVSRRKDVPFPWVFWLFVAFILLCGTTHLMDALIFWVPLYRLNAVVLFLTAVTSIGTFLALIPVLPKAFALRSPKALEAELKIRTQSLMESESNFRLLVSGIKDYGIFQLDPQGYIVSWNEGAATMKGYSADEVIGRHFSIFYLAEEVAKEKPRQELDIALRQGRYNEEGWRVRKDGSRFWASVVITPIFNEQYELLGFSKVVRDLTERKLAEEQLRRVADDLFVQTQQLKAVNQELEAFSYSVSHDLRAPLRSMNGYSQVLLEEYADRLDDTGRGYLQRIQRSSVQMAQLIDDLLDLARVARMELQQSEVDLSAMASEIITELRTLEPERHAEIHIQPGLKHRGDARLLRILLHDLFENAWKFTRDRDPTRIEFGSRREKGHFVYFVRDNGVGFDMAYVNKLFEAFQRLHGPEFEGTGVGLATAHRIVSRHGGRLWAEGKPGEGATFYFELNAEWTDASTD